MQAPALCSRVVMPELFVNNAPLQALVANHGGRPEWVPVWKVSGSCMMCSK